MNVVATCVHALSRHSVHPWTSSRRASSSLLQLSCKMCGMKRLLPILLFFLSAAALAESGAYRVEIIVFQNLAVIADGVQVEEFRSFSKFPALLEADLPDDLTAADQKSAYMDGVWRRLRSSKGYRPLLFAAWQQNRTDYYPPMRIHDEMLVDQQLRPPTHIMIADLAAEDPLGAYLSSFYRLDGTLQLRRSRFLHLFLDLEYREEISQPGSDTQASFFSIKDPALSDSAAYNIYSLQQNRQIRSGQLQYFDTPYFGALVLVTAIAGE